MPWGAVKVWHLSKSEKSIIGDQKSIISARLFNIINMFFYKASERNSFLDKNIQKKIRKILKSSNYFLIC